ncbi:MAG: alpha/beta hydrolase [Gemmatimonadetes bacterium]|nr:alpha/beta hydrolase [Gemmatimonadota bacterium]
MHGCLHGEEGPTIVLAAGAGQDSRTWAPLVEELASIGRVVSFDRPGLGRSPDVEGPRTPTVIALEIRDLLATLGVSGPAILVGHSMGGIHVLRYADMFPESVAGVLLLDTPPPGFEQDRMSLLSEHDKDQRRRELAEGRARAPVVVGRERDGADLESWEFSAFPVTRPLIVVVGDSQYFGELGSQEAHRQLWVRRSEEWLGLSRRSEFVVAAGSGHMIHHDRPQLVVELIRRLVR